MKKTMVLPAMAGALLLTACTHNAIDEFHEVGPSETAFLIALDGDTMTVDWGQPDPVVYKVSADGAELKGKWGPNGKGREKLTRQ